VSAAPPGELTDLGWIAIVFERRGNVNTTSSRAADSAAKITL
jgi:hypothetical protein